MRKVTEQIKQAWINNQCLTIGNTSTDGTSIFLHGNKIIKRNEDGSISVTNSGWYSNTTKERLNMVCRCHRSKGQWFINDIPYTGGWVNIGHR